MQLRPKPENYPRIRKALTFFKISSVITGIMLFGLYIISSIRWFMHSDIYLFTGNAIAELVQLPPEGVEYDVAPEGINFTVIFLILHGWFYVVYLIAGFSIWSPMRWSFGRFIMIAIAGCVIVLSFIVERWIVRNVEEELARGEAEQASGQTQLSST